MTEQTDLEKCKSDLAAVTAERNRLDKRVLALEGPDRNVLMLHPVMRGSVIELQKKLKEAKLQFELFEGWRSPIRQEALYASNPRVTNARAWRSAHQYGLAADFVWRDGKFWSWDDEHPWHELKKIATSLRLDVPITWDRGHIQHPLWKRWKAAADVPLGLTPAADWNHNER